MKEDWRTAVCTEARSWIGTPFHHAANIKGVGVDCCMLLIECFKAVGVIEPTYDPRPYTPDWYLHRSDEIFMKSMSRYAKRITEPQAGDVALYRIGRTASHGGIVLADGILIHAYQPRRVVELAELATWLPHLESYWTVL